MGETEMITDNLNPVFVKSIIVDYCFEEKQEIKISIYDIDDFSEKAVMEQNLIGNIEFRMDELIYAPEQTLNLEIQS